MRKLDRALLILIAALAGSAGPAWAASPAGTLAAAFGAAPQQTDMTLSPGGRMLAWQQPNGSGSEVVLYSLDARKVRRTLQIAGMSVDWLAWEDDGTLLIDTAQIERLPPGSRLDWGRAVRVSRILSVDVASGRSRTLLADRLAGGSGYFDTGANLLAWDIPQRAHTVIMAANVFDQGEYRQRTGTMIHSARGDSGMVDALFSVDTATGKDKTIAQGDGFTSQWVVDADGDLLARTQWQAHHFRIFAREGRDWRQIYRHVGPVEPEIAGVDRKSHAILAIVRGGDGRRRLWAIPLDGSAPTRMLPAVRQQVLSVDFSRYTDVPTAVWVGRSDPHRIWLDTGAESRYESIANAFPGREVRVYDLSRNGGKVMAEVQGSSDPPIYYLIDFSNHHAEIAGETYPQLAHVALGKITPLQYQTRAGQTVSAQLVLPPAGGKDLPLVVLAPGGPEASNPGTFDWFAQYLAALGYAVLRPDIALDPLATVGGAVYWGGISQRYAVDGVHILVQKGVADARRVCIVGVGYGGYAALSGVAFSPGTYACAVSVNGISDVPKLLGHERDVFGGSDSDHSVLAAWHTYVGSRFDPKLIARSPVHAATAVVAPVLLIHAENDTVVPVSQSLEMKSALERAGKAVRLLELDSGDHRMTRASTRIEVLKSVGGFLRKHLH